MSVNQEIPAALINEVGAGNAALFFGAGASRGAAHRDPKAKMPLGHELRDLICDEFLGGDCKDRALDEVVSFVENEGGPVRLENFIANLMRAFAPSPGHLLLPHFRWQALYSLNYDRLIEDAYAAASDRMQTLYPFYKDEQSIDRRLREQENSLGLFKLHGCIDRLNDRDAPLILSQDSYLRWHENRRRLYSRLEDSVAEYPVIFCGTTLADPHIRKLLSDASKTRPMQYVVSPSLNERDGALFASRRITPIKATFDDFMARLNADVPVVVRRLQAKLPATSHPIQRHFNSNSAVPPSILAFLDQNVDLVHAGLPTNAVSPSLFYKGESQSWSPIEQGLDIQRSIYESVMLKVLGFQSSDQPTVDIVVVNGVAGSGKTVFTRRLAYDLATKYSVLTLFAPPRAAIRAEAVRDIYLQTGKRQVIVIDQAADQIYVLADLVRLLSSWGVPASVVLADTQASFGNTLEELAENIRFTYDVKKLSEGEIRSLLGKLEEHKCLGLLESASPEERFDSFSKYADRQLLVALYEATQGKPLEEIILDEYNRIALTEAQELYLIVCTLNQYKVPVRAGLVRRLTGVDFEQFQKRLLEPLTDIVFSTVDPVSRDRVYRARHSQIAQIVFKKVLDTNSKRVNQFIRVVGQMDTSYSSDNDAMRQMINYRNLRDVAPIIKDRRDIIEVAEEVTGRDVYVLQQRALLEMNDAKGNLSVAREYLDEAQERRPNDKSLRHSRATLLSREAKARPNDLSRKVLRNEAKGILKALSADRSDPYVASLSAQLAIDEISDRLSTGEVSESADAQLLRLVEDAERAIRDGLSTAPDFETLMLSEARLRELLGQDARSVATLKRAVEGRPQLEYIAVAYAKAIKSNNLTDAIAVLSRSIVHKPYSKPLNQALFELMLLKSDDARDELFLPLRRAFTDDDGNLAMHVHMLRYHFLRRSKEDYIAARDLARQLKVPHKEKEWPRFRYKNPATTDGRYSGVITEMREGFAFVQLPGMLADIFLKPGISMGTDLWDTLGKSRSVTLSLCFNASGAIGTDVS